MIRASDQRDNALLSDATNTSAKPCLLMAALPRSPVTLAEDFAAGLCFLSSLSLSADTDDSVSAGTGVGLGTLTTGVACAAGSCASGFGTCAVAVSLACF